MPVACRYTDDIGKALLAYFNGGYLDEGDPIPTIQGAGVKLGIPSPTLALWADKFPAVAEALKKGEDVKYQILLQKMMDKNAFTPGVIFASKNLMGWADKIETHNENMDVSSRLSQARQAITKLKAVKGGKDKESTEDEAA